MACLIFKYSDIKLPAFTMMRCLLQIQGPVLCIKIEGKTENIEIIKNLHGGGVHNDNRFYRRDTLFEPMLRSATEFY